MQEKLQCDCTGKLWFSFDCCYCCCILLVTTRLSLFKNFEITFSIRGVRLLSFGSSLCLVIFNKQAV